MKLRCFEGDKYCLDERVLIYPVREIPPGF
jgi:hypothetical protein